MLSHLPEQLESERLIIRTARPGDGAMFNAAIIASHDELSPWLAWVNPAPTIEQSEATCQQRHNEWLANTNLMAFFLLKSTGELIGGSGLHKPNWTLRHFEVGYWGNSQFSGQGLVTEGVKALAAYALHSLKANRVYLSADQANSRSTRLAERAGFELEGTLRNERLNLSGQLRHTRVYSMIPDEQAAPT
jgi:RimJ/RimL family protein N-acetyltransferase